MPGLPWVRLAANIYSHDKILQLKARRDGWRAIAVYMQSLAYAGGHGTDGFIARHVLPVIDGTERIALMLCEVRLWDYAEGGYQIHNWADRQEPAWITEKKRESQRASAARTNCKRYHGPDCGCWKNGGGQVVDMSGKGVGRTAR